MDAKPNLGSCQFDLGELLQAGDMSLHADHKWGYELWCYNGEQCLKIMVVDALAKSSLMYHPIKIETFVMLQGHLLLEREDTKRILVPGDVVTIHPYEKHRFQSLEETAVFLEVSSHHEDEDVVKLEPSKYL